MLDLLIEGGAYPDFQAGCLKRDNIGIQDGKIVYIGGGIPSARRTIEADRRIVSPGFIDIHMHEEDFAGEGRAYVISELMLAMGVTTCVGGNCGVQHQSVSDFRRIVEDLGGSPVNYLLLTGYNHFRTMAGIGRYETASRAQIEKVKEQMREELMVGACGISFGIEYDPGMSTDEILFALQGFDDPHMLTAAHYRADGAKALSAIREMIAICDAIPGKFQISHLSSCSAMGEMREALELINNAMEKDESLNYDTYPYAAFSTHIGSSVFEDGCLEAWGKTYADILLTDDPYANRRCDKELFEKARKEYPEMLAVAFVMNEEEIAMAIANPHGMVASDGIINHGKGHPRASGTFPRLLGKYVREEKTFSLLDALRKITWEPAQRLELSDKGSIREGADADITIFDPETIRDRSTWTELAVRPAGIEYVLVNGGIAVDHDQTTDAGCGRFIEKRIAV